MAQFFDVTVLTIFLHLLDFDIKNFFFPRFQLLVVSPQMRPPLKDWVRNINRYNSFQNDVKFIATISMSYDIFEGIVPLKLHMVDQLLDFEKSEWFLLVFEVLILQHFVAKRILLFVCSISLRFQEDSLDFNNIERMRLWDSSVFFDIGFGLCVKRIQEF